MSDQNSKGETELKKSGAPQMTPAEEAWDLAKTVFFAVAIALVLRIVIFQPFNIPSGSMKPNLLVGDFLVVSKPTFGYSKASLVYPLTRLPVEGRILQGASPERGDVIVFKNRKDGNKDYIKRVIGLPGDRVTLADGRVWVNGHLLNEPYVAAVDTSSYLSVEVEDEHYFVLGDNRPRSSDSREFGQVPEELIRGRVDLRLWPPSRAGWVQ